MKGTKNKALYEIANYQGILNTTQDCEKLAKSVSLVLIKHFQTYIYTRDWIPNDIFLKFSEDFKLEKEEIEGLKFTELDIRRAIQLARHTVSNEDQIIKEIEHGTDF